MVLDTVDLGIFDVVLVEMDGPRPVLRCSRVGASLRASLTWLLGPLQGSCAPPPPRPADPANRHTS